jgi:hypothetical protein
MTVDQLRQRLTPKEYLQWAAFLSLKSQREQVAQ